ncbi:hypothetical protein K1719_038478 [Acacia pycnantha]|nr:hypothetical protein K1719_038478 [Acacia pycnantha]
MTTLSEKEETLPSPVTEDTLRSTKKVRIRIVGAEEGDENAMERPDVLMQDKTTTGGTSYRNKLLNLDRSGNESRISEEIKITAEDYKICQDGDIPSVEFSKAVRDVLMKGMEKTLVIKLLGRSILYRDLLYKTKALWQTKGSYQLVDVKGSFFFATFDLEEDYTKVLTDGPWMIFGSYLTVQPWSIEFDSHSAIISKVVAWVRILGLSFRYYHKSTLRVIGNLLGDVVKIDYMTETKGRGKYARIAVLIDLQKPLIPWIKVDGQTYGVEYEGLPFICFECGKYGHTKEKCKGGVQNSSQMKPIHHAVTMQAPQSDVHTTDNSRPLTGSASEDSSSPYGSWMLVRYPKKTTKQQVEREVRPGGLNISGGSRYKVLSEHEATETNVTPSGRADPRETTLKKVGMDANIMADQTFRPEKQQQPITKNKSKNTTQKMGQEYRRKVPVEGIPNPSSSNSTENEILPSHEPMELRSQGQ